MELLESIDMLASMEIPVSVVGGDTLASESGVFKVRLEVPESQARRIMLKNTGDQYFIVA